MATRVKKAPFTEEVQFRTDNSFLSLLLNRRNQFMRVIDYRAGSVPSKRLYIQDLARKEGIRKVLTLVEKDEISSWTKVGFVREGTIPGFYKRSDGHLVGCVIGDRIPSDDVSDDTVRLADRTINAAKRNTKDFVPIKGVSLSEEELETAEKERDQVWKKGSAFHTFDDFGRDAQRSYFRCVHRKKEWNLISAEYQECFGHSLVEVLQRPDGEQEELVLMEGLRELGEQLKERGIVSVFSFAPADDVVMATVFTGAGYRKTGLLASGVLVGDERKDAILWTQKLMNPGDEV